MKKRVLRGRGVNIHTLASIETAKEYDNWNAKHPEDPISWVECIRRGFYSLLREKQGVSCAELFEDLPLQARQKIEGLSKKISELSSEMEKLRSVKT